MSAPDRPTRGRTQRGRLRALDAWVTRTESALLRRTDGVWAEAPFVDVGFGEHPWTTLASAEAFRALHPGLPVVGLEREPHRVALAAAEAPEDARWVCGGFEALATLPNPPRLVRAMNVLRAYPAPEIAAAHQLLSASLLPGGLLLEGSADPTGALCTAHLIRQTSAGPMREALWFWTDFTLGFAPMQFRDWLPRDLRRRVVPPEPIEALLRAWTQSWSAVRATASLTPREAFAQSAAMLRTEVEGVDFFLHPTGAELVWRPPAGVPEPLLRQ